MLVMPVKRLAGLVLIFLVLGLTASSAMATSDIVPKSTQGTPQTVGCPCCSGNVSPKNFKIQVLRGATSYLIAMHVFSVDIPNIAGHLNLSVELIRPQYPLSYVRIGKTGNSTVEQVAVPLLIKTEEEYKGILLSLRNSTGVYSVLAIRIEPGEIYGVYTERSLDGTVKDSGRIHILFDKSLVQKYSSILPHSKIVVPLDKFMKVCTWTVNKVCEKGFGRFIPCGFCWGASLWPIGPAICFLVCWYLEDKVLEKICKGSVEALCKKLAESLVIIE